MQREKKGFCVAALSSEVGTALINSLSLLWGFRTRLQGIFFYCCSSYFDSFNYFPPGVSEARPCSSAHFMFFGGEEKGAVSTVQPAQKVFISRE